MLFCVDWTFFARVSNQAKCERIIAQAQQSTALPFDEIRIERYWKDKSFFKIDTKSCVDAPSAKDAFYLIMRAANGIAHRWIVNGPNEDGVWEFAGTADVPSLRIQGLESVEFRSISNIESSSHALTSEKAV